MTSTHERKWGLQIPVSYADIVALKLMTSVATLMTGMWPNSDSAACHSLPFMAALAEEFSITFTCCVKVPQ